MDSSSAVVPRQHYQVYGSRFTIMLLFCGCTAMSAFMWICFSPRFDVVQERYAASTLDINALSMTYMIAYLPGSLIALAATAGLGLRGNLIMAASFNAACGVIRYLGNLWSSPRQAFAVVMFGQLMGALGQPLMLNAPARIANDFFPATERDFATIVMFMANSLGNAAGALLPAFTVQNTGDIAWLLLAQAIPTVILLVLTVLFATDKPPTPPSAAAAAMLSARLLDHGGINQSTLSTSTSAHTQAKPSFRLLLKQLLHDFKLLLTNWNFLLLLVGFSVAAGTVWAFLTVMAQMLTPCGYDESLAGVCGAALLGVGIISSLLSGPILQRTRAYNPIQKVMMVLTLIATVLVLALNSPGSPAKIIVAYCVFGFLVIPVFPISLEYTAEMTYPVPADNGAALLLLFANTVSLVLTFALTPLLQLPVSQNCTSVVTPAAGVILGFMIVGVAFVMPLKAKYLRAAAEQQDAAHGTKATASSILQSRSSSTDSEKALVATKNWAA